MLQFQIIHMSTILENQRDVDQEIFVLELAHSLMRPENYPKIPTITRDEFSLLYESGMIKREHYVKLIRGAFDIINKQIPLGSEHVQFTDNDTKASWELDEQVRRLNLLIPEEGFKRPENHGVTFSEDYSLQGFQVASAAGGMMVMSENMYHVPSRTLIILDVLDIPYTTLP